MLASWKPWIRTVALGLLGGSIAAIYAIIIDPRIYHWPQDFGSGKMWEYFLGGALLTVGGVLVESPLGKRLMHPFEGKEKKEKKGEKGEGE
jgi:hypothetical protein